MSNPYFSILVPTRNRAGLLREILPTVIDQTFGDYEIIVSDNNSTDDTREVVEKFKEQCPLIRYVNPGESLSMCSHFDYIYRQAKGKYVCYVSDDDGIVPEALAITREAIEQSGAGVLVWGCAGYYHQDIPEAGQRGRMWGHLGTGELYEIASQVPIKAYLDFEFEEVWGLVPKMLRAVVHRDLIETCLAKSGGIFHLPPFPDHSASCQLIATNAHYHILDLPLYIAGVSYHSNAGIRYNRKEKFDEYCGMFAEDLLEDVPYALRYVNAPYFYAGIRHFQQLYPERLEGAINVENYLRMELAEVLRFKEVEDIAEELTLLKHYMREFSGGDKFYKECFTAVRSSRWPSKVKRKTLQYALARPILVDALTVGRRYLSALRGRRSLSFGGVASMKEAAMIAQRAIDAEYRPGSVWRVRSVNTREGLCALQ